MTESREEILSVIKQAMVKLFELDESEISESASLYEDLDVDSIDAIDLLIELKKSFGKDVEADAFVNARTLGDIVDIVQRL